MMQADLFYLDNRGTNWTNEWKYFRVTSIFGMHIEVCEVEFPSMTDKGIATQHPFIVGLNAAYDIKGKHLKTLGIDQDRSILIGMIVRENGQILKAKAPSLAEPREQ